MTIAALLILSCRWPWLIPELLHLMLLRHILVKYLELELHLRGERLRRRLYPQPKMPAITSTAAIVAPVDAALPVPEHVPLPPMTPPSHDAGLSAAADLAMSAEGRGASHPAAAGAATASIRTIPSAAAQPLPAAGIVKKTTSTTTTTIEDPALSALTTGLGPVGRLRLMIKALRPGAFTFNDTALLRQEHEKEERRKTKRRRRMTRTRTTAGLPGEGVEDSGSETEGNVEEEEEEELEEVAENTSSIKDTSGGPSLFTALKGNVTSFVRGDETESLVLGKQPHDRSQPRHDRWASVNKDVTDQAAFLKLLEGLDKIATSVLPHVRDVSSTNRSFEPRRMTQREARISLQQRLGIAPPSARVVSTAGKSAPNGSLVSLGDIYSRVSIALGPAPDKDAVAFRPFWGPTASLIGAGVRTATDVAALPFQQLRKLSGGSTAASADGNAVVAQPPSTAMAPDASTTLRTQTIRNTYYGHEEPLIFPRTASEKARESRYRSASMPGGFSSAEDVTTSSTIPAAGAEAAQQQQKRGRGFFSFFRRRRSSTATSSRASTATNRARSASATTTEDSSQPSTLDFWERREIALDASQRPAHIITTVPLMQVTEPALGNSITGEPEMEKKMVVASGVAPLRLAIPRGAKLVCLNPSTVIHDPKLLAALAAKAAAEEAAALRRLRREEARRMAILRQESNDYGFATPSTAASTDATNNISPLSPSALSVVDEEETPAGDDTLASFGRSRRSQEVPPNFPYSATAISGDPADLSAGGGLMDPSTRPKSGPPLSSFVARALAPLQALTVIQPPGEIGDAGVSETVGAEQGVPVRTRRRTLWGRGIRWALLVSAYTDFLLPGASLRALTSIQNGMQDAAKIIEGLEHLFDWSHSGVTRGTIYALLVSMLGLLATPLRYIVVGGILVMLSIPTRPFRAATDIIQGTISFRLGSLSRHKWNPFESTCDLDAALKAPPWHNRAGRLAAFDVIADVASDAVLLRPQRGAIVKKK
jgi:hypothetical protein